MAEDFYRDANGRLGQADGDKGDSCQRTASYITLKRFLGEGLADSAQLINLYEVASGRYVRYAGPANEVGRVIRYIPWYGNPNNFTRDQSVVLQAALVIEGNRAAMWRLFKARAKRFLFHFNTESYDDQEPITKKFPDMPNFVECGQFIRGLNAWYLYPVLFVTDLQNLFDVLLFRYVTKRAQWDSDNMLLPIVVSNNYKYPTTVSWITKKLYKLSDAPKRLAIYHSEQNEANGNEALGRLYIRAFEAL